MKTLTSVSLALLIATPVFALDTNFCDSTKGLEQLTEYINCSGSTKLAACGALGGIVAGRITASILAARREIEDLMSSNRAAPLSPEEKFKVAVYKEDFESRKGGYKINTYEDFDRALTAEINRTRISLDKAEVLKRLVPPVDPNHFVARGSPHLEAIDGKVYDVFELRFDELPKNSRFYSVLAEQNKFVTDAILERAAAKGALDSEFILETAKKMKHDFVLKAYHNPGINPFSLVGSKLDYQESVVKSAVKIFKQQNSAAFQAGAKGISTVSRSLVKMGEKGWMLTGGIFGAGLAVASEVALPDKTACSTLSESYINVDSDCKPVYEVSDKVLRFLDKSVEEQTRILKSDAKACDFYKKLHAKAFEQNQITALECKADGLVATAKVPGYQDLRYIVSQDADGHIKRVSAYQGRQSKSNATFNMNAAGEIESYDRGGDKVSMVRKDSWPTPIATQLRQIKLLVPEMLECCRSRDESCKKDFGLTSDSPNPDSPSPVKSIK